MHHNDARNLDFRYESGVYHRPWEGQGLGTDVDVRPRYDKSAPHGTTDKKNNNTKKRNNSKGARSSKSRAKSHKKLKSAKSAKLSYSEMLMGNKGLAISILSKEDKYLSKMVKDNKAKYLPILFDMVDIM